MSGSAFTMEADVQFDHSSYVLRVLEAPHSVRIQVRAKAVELAEANGSNCQKQLVCILTMFEALTAEQQGNFIYAYRACATLSTQGAREVVNSQTWDPLQIPPRQEP